MLNVKSLFAGNQKRTIILRWIGTIGSFILLIILLRNQGWVEIVNAFQEVSFRSLIICVLLIFISRFAVVSRWYALLNAVEDFSFWQSTKITFAGLFASNFLPTTVGGDVIRFAGTVQLEFDGVRSAASLIADRLIGMFGMALALPFGASQLISWLSIGQFSQRLVWGGSIISRQKNN